MDRLPRIVGVGAWKPSHVAIRLENPLEAISKAGYAHTITVQPNQGIKREDIVDIVFGNEEEKIPGADLVVLQGPSTQWHEKLIDYCKEFGVKVVVEHDDHPFLMSVFNPAYVYWGLKERTAAYPDGEIVQAWKDGQPRTCLSEDDDAVFDLERNRKNKRMWLRCIKKANALVVTNERLRQTFRSFKTWRLPGTPIGIVPNYINFEMWRRFRIMEPKPTVRIGWHGGWSHQMDLYSIRDALREVAIRFPHVVFVFYGYVNERVIDVLPKQQVEIIHWTDSYPEFVYRMMTLDLDIGIAPLTGSVFDACKSPLKFLEYGALGIPSVLTNCEPYSTVVGMEKGRDTDWPAMLANTHRDWVEMLSALIRNEPARLRMGENAHRLVRTYFDLQGRARDIWEVYDRILHDDFRQPVSGARDVPGALDLVEHSAR